MPEYMKGSQAAIAQLVAEGVTHVLSIPGERNIALCDVILDNPQLIYLTTYTSRNQEKGWSSLFRQVIPKNDKYLD